MASRELGSLVDSELNSLGVNTPTEVRSFRVPGPRQKGNMKTVLDNINTSRGKVFTSRKRVRHDALRLLREGAL